MSETNIPTSFIPHDTAQQPSKLPQLVQSASAGELLLLLSIVLFVASIALAGGVFLYEQYLNTSSASKLAQLQRAKAAFEPSLIQQLTRLDDRMQMSQTIINDHIAPSAFFAALGQSTLQTVQFSGLALDSTNPQKIHITMAGVARSINSVALQAEIFSKNGIIKNPIFSGIDRQSDGVHFSVTADIDPTALNYSQIINALASGTSNPQAQQAAAAQAAPSSPFGAAPTTGSTDTTQQAPASQPTTNTPDASAPAPDQGQGTDQAQQPPTQGN